MTKLTPLLRTILEAATKAPSGENCQPWQFRITGEKSISIYIDPSKDQSPYSWGQRASYVAIGAAIENIHLAAEQGGLFSHITFFPEGENSDLVANITFETGAAHKNLLAPCIYKRVTNRKAYKKQPLSEEEKQNLLDAMHIDSDISGKIVTDTEAINTLGDVGSTNEVIMLNNQYLHEFFFSHVNWTEEEDQKKKIGFYIKTLELPPPAQVGFKVLRNWKRAQMLNKIFSFNKIVGKQNGAVNAQAGGMGIITVSNNTPLHAVKAGRALQRVWLTATRLGLSLQPLTGILYFHLAIQNNDSRHFNENEIVMIKNAFAKIQKTFNLSQELPLFMYRVGKSKPPSAQATRFTVEELLLH